MDKPKKEPSENDVLAVLLKVKPTADMPKSGAHPTKGKASKCEEKPKK